MAIGVAETPALHGRLDEKLLGDRFLANWRGEPDRGYALGPVKVFDLVAGAFHWEGEIPGGWHERLENRDCLRKLGLLLCHAKSAHAREGATG
jgi:hypothetical protein